MNSAAPYASEADPLRYVRRGRLPYKITPFFRRRIDLSRPVEVYRNLNKPGQTYSVRQNGLVKGHASALMLCDAEFVFHSAGALRAAREGRRNVHAWIRGLLSSSAMGTCLEGDALPCRIIYTPRGFVDDTPPRKRVLGAMAVMIRGTEVTAAYVDWYNE